MRLAGDESMPAPAVKDFARSAEQIGNEPPHGAGAQLVREKPPYDDDPRILPTLW